MKRETKLFSFALIFFVILFVYIFSISYTIKSYNDLNIIKTTKNSGITGDVTNIDPLGENTLRYIFYADIVVVTVSVIFLIILIFLIYRKREIELNKRVLVIKARNLLKRLKDEELSDMQIRDMFKRKGWRDEELKDVLGI